MKSPAKSFGNTIINSISGKHSALLSKNSEKISMRVGKYLYRCEEISEYIYFPLTAVISIVAELNNGNTVEAGIIGREGSSAAALRITDGFSPTTASVQLSGYVYRVPLEIFRQIFDEDKMFRDAALHHFYSFVAQVTQNAACLCFHNIDRRLARWLLMFADRSEKSTLNLTQEFMSEMLGVQRPTMSKTANFLQKAGFVEYQRGKVRIVNRAELEKHACECYGEVNRYAERAK